MGIGTETKRGGPVEAAAHGDCSEGRYCATLTMSTTLELSPA